MNDFNNNQNNIPSVPPVPSSATPNPEPAPKAQPRVTTETETQIPQPAPQPIQQPVEPRQVPPQPTPRPAEPRQIPQPQPAPQYTESQQIPPQAPHFTQTPPQPQQAPVQPPQYPQGIPYTPQPPKGYAPQGQPYGQPVQPDNYSNPNYAYAPKAAPKQPMSGPVKAFVVIVIAILAASLIGFIVYINSESSGNASFNTPASTEYNNYPTLPGGHYYQEETVPQSNKEYKQSDAQKETDPKFGGIKINKKPAPNSPNGAESAFKNVEKSVVGVICYTDEQEGTSTSFTTMGSGIIVTSNGYIVTNAHIINNSRTSYLFKIITADKKSYDAGVVGFDSRYDLAVLKINAKDLPAANFGDSEELRVTEDVIAIGNPRSINYQNSVTKGIVSALNRQASTTNNAKFIQTDAAINPGNSGGPLCNMYGQVVGINTSKIALEEYEGMGFAIPSNTVKAVADSIIKYSYVKGRVKIGIVGTVATKSSDGAYGIIIDEIGAGGPMEGTGAQKGDIITKIAGKEVYSFTDVYNILEKYKAGDKVKVTLYRPSTDKTYDITIKLQEDKQ